MKNTVNIYLQSILVLILAFWAMGARALSLDTYAPASRLAEGKWVKISIKESGLYRITPAQLRQWGFDDPERVRVYGYGGNRIPDALTAANYVDDLPQVQQINTASGIVFYGLGPEKWVLSTGKFYHAENNIYTTEGYYFLSDTGEDLLPIEVQGTGEASANAQNSFLARVHYEVDRITPGETGYSLVGESFKVKGTQKYTLETPGAMADSLAWFECAVVSKHLSGTTLTYAVNGKTLPKVNSDNVVAASNSVHVSGVQTLSRHEFTHGADKMEVSVTYNGARDAVAAWFDYLSVNYTRALSLPTDGMLAFTLPKSSVRLQTSVPVRVLDVTNPASITELAASAANGEVTWTNDFHGMRSYVAFSESASLPSPELVGKVTNQNLHALNSADMVILTLPELAAQAERLARLHAEDSDPIQAIVVDVNQVYNEFSSGMADISGLRKFLKMIYDRGNSADTVPTLRYALLMGRATYDNRHLTAPFASPNAHNTIPVWMGGAMRLQYSDNDAYGTDDFLAMLDDGSGTSLGLNNLSVGVGRMPLKTATEARNAVDKLEQYLLRSKRTSWKNHFLFLADGGDSGIHARQSEDAAKLLLATDQNQSMVWRVYSDAFTLEGGKNTGARKEFYRLIDEGVLWWNYIGHANNHSMTGSGIVTYIDLNNFYPTNVPILMAATCDFLRWDSDVLSGGEILFHERYGGTIATISATRPVYIADNGYLTRAIARAITKRDSQGRHTRLGDIYRTAKNNILDNDGIHRSNMNRLRYVLMGDPAMPLLMPSDIVTLDAVDGVDVNDDNQIILSALSQPVFSGSVRRPDGSVRDDFNGQVEINIYDAEHSTTVAAEDDGTGSVTYDQQGSKIFSGMAKVEAGRFSLRAPLPAEIADNFRNATMNLYAFSHETGDEAIGVNRDFYVYGIDENAPIDNVPPVIDYLVLNHDSFRSGDSVNESPMLIASVSDDTSINLSMSGVGHQMSITLDEINTFNDVTLYFSASAENPGGGTINYPLSNLTPGHHTLRLKVWDTSGNSATFEIEFNVVTGMAPEIFKIYSDANPATTEANFYISHNRPDQLVNVTVTVYNLLGHPIWQGSASGRSDMFSSVPVTWNLTDAAGRRVPRGIYLYRAAISTANGEEFTTASSRIAVAAK